MERGERALALQRLPRPTTAPSVGAGRLVAALGAGPGGDLAQRGLKQVMAP